MYLSMHPILPSILWRDLRVLTPQSKTLFRVEKLVMGRVRDFHVTFALPLKRTQSGYSDVSV